ncbi:MAG: tetratricopeptide repeat protein [Magnetococcales bacterium]|nr:tetratricopeptide repeat protein [Magnetococcales bacterium]
MNQSAVNEIYATALEHYEAGRLQEAESLCLSLVRDHAKHLSLLGSIAMQVGRPDIAVGRFSQAVEVLPDSADINYNLAVALMQKGELEEAVSAFDRAVQLGCGQSGLPLNRANALHRTGKTDEAIAWLRQLGADGDPVVDRSRLVEFLVTIKHFEEALREVDSLLDQYPDLPHFYFNKGLILKELRQGREAIVCFERAVEIQPDLTVAFNNIGATWQDLGELAQAVRFFRQAVGMEPNNSIYWFNLAKACLKMGDRVSALSSIRRAIAFNRTEIRYWNCYVDIITSMSELQVSQDLIDELKYCLSMPELASSKLRKVVFILLSRQIIVTSLVLGDDSLHYTNFNDLFSDKSLSAKHQELSHPLFLDSLSEEIVTFPPLEHFLSAMRRHLLEASVNNTLDDILWNNGLAFLCALANQCFLNEYIYWQTEVEEKLLESLVNRVAKAFKVGQKPCFSSIALIGAYRPLWRESFADQLRDHPGLVDCSGMTRLLRIQIDEPREELRIREDIPILTSIHSKISRKVQEQYEENPYPRWIMPYGKPPFPILNYMSTVLPNLIENPPQLPSAPKILVAGCGTGRQPIDLAITLPASDIKAIDLSRASLAYAQRKAREMDISNIHFGQADLLELSDWQERYDLIACSGVLHHMEDPERGLDVLLACLKPGGVMQLGLYSETARQGVIAARSLVAKQGYSSSIKDIRHFRQKVYALPADNMIRKDTMFNDFFATSPCRDLFFHVQEHRFSLPQLQEIFSCRQLRFLGFAMFEGVYKVFEAYFQRFPDDPQGLSLENWAVFEEENPNTFSSMYQFYIQKPSMK